MQHTKNFIIWTAFLKWHTLIIIIVFTFLSLATIDAKVQITGDVISYDRNTVILLREYTEGRKRKFVIPRNLIRKNIRLKTGRKISISVDVDKIHKGGS